MFAVSLVPNDQPDLQIHPARPAGTSAGLSGLSALPLSDSSQTSPAEEMKKSPEGSSKWCWTTRTPGKNHIKPENLIDFF